MEEEEAIDLIRKKEMGEKIKKRKERDDQGGKALMERAMKAARTEAPDNDEEEPKATIGSRRSSAAKQIAAARERCAELHLERSQVKMEVQREIELERIRSMERIEKMKAD